jgi:PST family polysaccharide transporter|tara:strand:- start:1222 stop:2502 length:1281 start_codon:yes stop_codon:yes gene_type:complete
MWRRMKKRIVVTEENKRLLTNIFSLGMLQGVNYILPLLTLPYLARVLGPEYFGLLAFSTAAISYFMLITDYGFNLSATQQISIHRDNKDKINEIFSSVMTIKIVLMVISFIIMSVLVLNIERFSQYWAVYFITFGTVIGQVIFPVWLFQGMERMKYITYLNISAKFFFTICIFIFVQEREDYLIVPLLTSLGFLVSGVFSLFLVRKKFFVQFKWQSMAVIKKQLSEGFHIFLSSISISFYTISTTFFLGVFTSNAIVAQFATVDKVVQAAKGLYAPVSQAIYPLIGKKLHVDKLSGLNFIRKITWLAGTGMFFVSTLLFVLADPIVSLLLGDQYQESTLLLKIMAFVPFFVTLSNIYGIQTMLNLGYKKEFNCIIGVVAFFGVSLSLFLVPKYEGVGTAVTLFVVETFVALSMYLYLKMKFKKDEE